MDLHSILNLLTKIAAENSLTFEITQTLLKVGEVQIVWQSLSANDALNQLLLAVVSQYGMPS